MIKFSLFFIFRILLALLHLAHFSWSTHSRLIWFFSWLKLHPPHLHLHHWLSSHSFNVAPALLLPVENIFKLIQFWKLHYTLELFFWFWFHYTKKEIFLWILKSWDGYQILVSVLNKLFKCLVFYLPSFCSMFFQIFINIDHIIQNLHFICWR
jgi:hypothetical protein